MPAGWKHLILEQMAIRWWLILECVFIHNQEVGHPPQGVMGPHKDDYVILSHNLDLKYNTPNNAGCDRMWRGNHYQV